METSDRKSIIGWNWGYYTLDEDTLKFDVKGASCFGLPYSNINLATATSKNEVAIELDLDHVKDDDKGDYLTELRFYLPENEGSGQDPAENNLDEQDEAEGEGNQEEEKAESKDDKSKESLEKTPAQLLADQIIKKAGIGAFAGEVIAKLDDMQLLVPRGKYSFNMYNNYLKIHGKTHDYKILYKDIRRAFILSKPDGVHMIYVVSLKSPLRQGQTAHHYLVMQFKRDREEKLHLNLSEEQLEKSSLVKELDDTLDNILARLFKALIGITIIMPSGFKSAKAGADAIKCSVRAQDGYLYPMQRSFLFIHKPVAYIRHEEILHLEFSRISEFAAAGRSFDINIVTRKSGTMTFTGIDKQEYKPIIEYLKTKNLRIRNADDDGKIMDLENEDLLVEKKPNRRAMQNIDLDDGQQIMEGEDSDEEDEDFDVAAQEQEESEFESHGSESLIEESDLENDKKPKSKPKPKKKEGGKKTKEEAKD